MIPFVKSEGIIKQVLRSEAFHLYSRDMLRNNIKRSWKNKAFARGASGEIFFCPFLLLLVF